MITAAVRRLIENARMQLGYLEKASNKQLDDFTANAGAGNYTIYGQWYKMNGQPWCAMFVSWCAWKAGIAETVIPKHASCSVGVNWFKKAGRWTPRKDYTPVPGDIIYFSRNGADPVHIGIVERVDASRVYTIEGNTSGGSTLIDNGGGVARKSYPLGYAYILGYGNPAYADEIKPLVDAVSTKVGIAAGYWYDALNGSIQVTPEILQELFKKFQRYLEGDDA